MPDAGQTWMEVAYGTKGGGVRVIVRHPENIGQAPQLFQSYNVHTCSVSKVVLGEKHLVSGKLTIAAGKTVSSVLVHEEGTEWGWLEGFG